MIPGYNTNGFAHHDLNTALEIVADLGFRCIALTPDTHHLPFDESLPDAIEHYGLILEQLDLDCVIETGSRFMLDPYRKHQPTLISQDEAERLRRRHFLEDHIDLAAELKAGVVSFWSGTAMSQESHDALMTRLAAECRLLCQFAVMKGVKLAFEPEPGMFIDTTAKWRELRDRVNHASFGLTLDIGHLVCMEESYDVIAENRKHLWNIHLDDMKRGVHDHLMFGEGEVDFARIFTILKSIQYAGPMTVELSRHSHDAVSVARRSFEFLKPYLAK